MNNSKSKINQENLEAFLKKFPRFLSSVKILNDRKINWMIGGSSCLFLLGNERVPDDADIFIADLDHDKVDKLLGMKSYKHVSPAGPVRNSNPDGDHSVQFTSHLEFNFDKKYKFEVTENVLSNKITVVHDGVELYLLPPEDVLLIKALLQRGKDAGKCDIEDINKFRTVYKINMKYLTSRIAELNAESRIGSIFR